MKFCAFVLSLTLITASASYYVIETSYGESVATLSKLGSRGEEVRRIQTKLKQLGFYNGSVDGIYGAATQKAVKRFQSSVGITADGIAGSKTLLYLGCIFFFRLSTIFSCTYFILLLLFYYNLSKL